MKTKFKVYKLHFTTPVHLGDERNDYSISLKTIRSDTLYAALTAALASIGKKIPENGDLGFTISSLFPFYQKSNTEKTVFFLPRLIKNSTISIKLQDYSKAIKNISWLDLDYFQKQIKGNNIFNEYLNVSDLKGSYLSGQVIEDDYIISEISPRVSVSRTGQEDATPFYMDRLYFKDDSGMYFIAEGDVKNIEIGLDILQHEGIGTDRNIGNGFFNFSPDTLEIEIPESNFATNLSLFCPKDKNELEPMLDDLAVSYDFIRRGGWITSSTHNTFRKNTIHMFAEASVFKMDIRFNKVFIKGQIVDLKPEISFQPLEHPVWRSGKAIFIPVIPVS